MEPLPAAIDLTIRLDPDDQIALRRLMDEYGHDESVTIQHVLQRAVTELDLLSALAEEAEVVRRQVPLGSDAEDPAGGTGTLDGD